MHTSNFYRIRNLIGCGLLLIVVSTFLTGCEFLPPGTPPEGPIVSIKTTDSEVLTPENAVNNMTTALATCPLLYSGSKKPPSVGLIPSEISEKEYEVPLRSLTAKLYRNLSAMNTITPPSFTVVPAFFIDSKFFKISDNAVDDKNDSAVFKWEVSLVSPSNLSKALWKQSVSVKVKGALKSK